MSRTVAIVRRTAAAQCLEVRRLLFRCHWSLVTTQVGHVLLRSHRFSGLQFCQRDNGAPRPYIHDFLSLPPLFQAHVNQARCAGPVLLVAEAETRCGECPEPLLIKWLSAPAVRGFSAPPSGIGGEESVMRIMRAATTSVSFAPTMAGARCSGLTPGSSCVAATARSSRSRDSSMSRRLSPSFRTECPVRRWNSALSQRVHRRVRSRSSWIRTLGTSGLPGNVGSRVSVTSSPPHLAKNADRRRASARTPSLIRLITAPYRRRSSPHR